MAKFKVLKINQTLLSLMGIYMDRSTHDTDTIFFSSYITITLFTAFMTSVAFILKNPSDIKPALGALKVCIGAIQLAGMFFGNRSQVNKMSALQNELQEIVNKGISIIRKPNKTKKSLQTNKQLFII